MKDMFFYRRNVTYKWPVKDPKEGEPKEETRTTTVWDCFNLNNVVSGRWISLFTFELILNDGHEQAEDVNKPLIKNGKQIGSEVKRERGWYLTKIELNGDDIYRYRAATEKLLDSEESEYFEKLVPKNTPGE